MTEKINWNFVAQVIKGPAISGAGKLDAEDYEKMDFTMVPGASHPVSLSNTGSMSLLIISSPTPDLKITYKGTPALPGEPTPDGYVLDGPHIFIGKFAGDFFTSATGLTFTNGTAADVEIQILIGRKTA